MSPTDKRMSSSSMAKDGEVLEIGARLENAPSEYLIRSAFRRELDDQIGLFDAMNRVDLAHTLVTIESGIVPLEPGRELLHGLLKLRARPTDFVPDPGKGDLYTNREAWISARTSAAEWLGAGRARREATTTAFLIKLREALLNLADALTSTNNAIAAKAEQFSSALMPDYTYLQPAQPTTFGHYLLGFVYPALRDMQRLRALYCRVNLSPAGSGSVNGSRLRQQRVRLSQLLGFDGLVVHARDAMWQADLPIEAASLLTAILVNLDRLAEDLQIYASEEFAMVDFDDRHARASKIMPQKKNPFALTHIRGLANSMIGTLTASAASGRTPSGQPDNRLRLYGTIPRAIEETTEAVNLIGEVVSHLVFNTAHARRKLANGFTIATDLAEELVMHCGLNFRQAHRLVGYLVRRHKHNGNLDLLTAKEVVATAEQMFGCRIELAQQKLEAIIDLEAAIAARLEPGGAAPVALDAMLGQCREELADSENWCKQQRLKLEAAHCTLLHSVQDCVRNVGKSRSAAVNRDLNHQAHSAWVEPVEVLHRTQDEQTLLDHYDDVSHQYFADE